MAGQSHFHTYNSAKAFRRNYAAVNVPSTLWTSIGGAPAIFFNKTGQVDGADEYQWSSDAEFSVQELDLSKNPSIAGTPVYFAVRVRALKNGTCISLGIDPGSGQWLKTVVPTNEGHMKCTPLSTSKWEVHSFAVLLGSMPNPESVIDPAAAETGRARFTLEAWRYNKTMPGGGGEGGDEPGDMSLVLPVVIAPVGADFNTLAGQHTPAACAGPPPPPPGPAQAPQPPPPPPPPTPPPPPALFRCVNDACVAQTAGQPGVTKAACELDCR